MKKIHFEILRLLEENKEINQLNEILFKDKNEIEEAINYLINEGYILNNQLTKKAYDYLEDHKIDNAIILAAGMSTRFVPLSYEIPKGLLDVKGQTLIERQITQLREKGINEIIVVVGYMKEAFKFLEEKYGVILVESPEYRTRNNHSSIYVAHDYLKNSIITSSDLYFTDNIFQKYAYDSYYCTIYEDGHTEERGILTDNDDRILETFYGERAHDVWVTLGYAFFSERFSKKMIEILDQEYNDEKTINKFWADIQDEHLSELYMYAKRCNREVINEFDSLEELRVFDEKYQNDSNCKIMKTICSLLDSKEQDIINIETLKNIKNSLFKFEYNNEVYVCDVEPNDSEEIIYNNKALQYYKSDKDVKLWKK